MLFYTDGIPPDGTPIHITHTYKTEVTVVFYILALCGVVFSVVCFAFNFIFRKKKYKTCHSTSLLVFISLVVITIQNCAMWFVLCIVDCFNFRVIRLTTPKLNFLMVSGAVLMYLSVLIGLLPTVNRHVFHIQCTVSNTTIYMYGFCCTLYNMVYTYIIPHRSLSGCMV